MKLFILALALVTGCSNGAPAAGIWLVQVDYDADAGVECTSDIVENFTVGYVPEADAPDESAWTFQQSTTGSDTLMFAQIEHTSPDQGLMIMGDRILPGEWDGTDWTFSWDDASGNTETSEHESGYKYSETSESSAKVTVKFTPGKGGAAAGKLTASGNTSESWTESDEWDTLEIVGFTGQIPSSDYLVYEEDDWEYSQVNRGDDSDCEGDVCRLSVATACAGSNTFSATLTDYSEEDSYAYLQMYGTDAE